uniref:Uncharacterized protein n=1 Tax=Heterorhabditis bacteriophora TaxID=37862 RepID=A0A1I7X2A4_HETBA
MTNYFKLFLKYKYWHYYDNCCELLSLLRYEYSSLIKY